MANLVCAVDNIMKTKFYGRKQRTKKLDLNISGYFTIPNKKYAFLPELGSSYESLWQVSIIKVLLCFYSYGRSPRR